VKEVDDAICEYLRSRNEFLRVAARHPNLLAGNDNVIGRIGEYLAISFLLRHQGRGSRKAKSLCEKGHDLLDGKIRISVKILTNENIAGRGVRLLEPWDELLVIDFDTTSLRYRVGHILKTRFEQALLDNPGWSAQPYVKKTMLGPNGLIGRYGSISDTLSMIAPGP
jgi:hypothetical protein